MSEQQPNRSAPFPHASLSSEGKPPNEGSSVKGKTDSQLRLIRPDEGGVVFPEQAEPSDDAPTIISKKKPGDEEPISVNQTSLVGRNLRGQRLAHFELLEPIGVGGMAAVLRARDTQLDRFVALKILPPEMARDLENVRRFHQEARSAAKLDHENIARVFFCGEDKNLHFIAFEFVEGENLRVLLERRGKLPVPEAVLYILQVAVGLEHASARGVVHRDIKPSNIIISSNGRAKLVDMGLARSLGPQNDQALTQSGMTLGTFDYISPEQALEPREADSRSDIYSLGCTFYHMLTGQAPVPEGTAAKKLHHHQHVPPIDPRQLNPEIPDEVAAILMRMMAKEVRDRYQQPLQLIQHLHQVAQQVGAGAEVPQGVLFLDTPLPGAPRLRPVLTVSLAVLGLGVLLMLLSMAPRHKQQGEQPQVAIPTKSDGGDREVPQPDQKLKGTGTQHDPVQNYDQLVQLLKEKNRGIIHLDRTITLPAGVTLPSDKNSSLVFKPADDQEPPTLQFHYQVGSGQVGGGVVGLTVDGGKVRFEGIRFKVASDDNTPEVPVAMVTARSGAVVDFVKCSFQQTKVPISKHAVSSSRRVFLASVLLDNTSGETADRPQVTFNACFWEQGQTAVALEGQGKVTATNCAFGPHRALFQFRGDTLDKRSEVNLNHCSAFVVYGPAFRLDHNARCKLQVAQSIFSSPDAGNPADCNFIQQMNDRDNLVEYHGNRNVYHNLNHLLLRLGDPGIPFLEKFKEEVGKNNGLDRDSTQLAKDDSPWKLDNPFEILQKKDQEMEAFYVQEKMLAVRTLDKKKYLGVQTWYSGNSNSMVALVPSLTDEPKTADIKLKPNQKIIDPDAESDDPAAGIFTNLQKAIPFLTFDGPSELLLKHSKKSRDVEIELPDLNDSRRDLTLKPYPGFRPLLFLNGKSLQRDVALFRLFDGKLHFENLEFLLEPDDRGYKAQSIIALGGKGECTFKNCVLTLKNLERADKRIPLTVFSFLDPEGEMKMASLAQVHMDDCLVRGEGDLVQVRGSRTFDLRIHNSLIALSGSLLTVQGASKELAMEMPAQLKLTQVTTLLSEPCLLLRGKSSRSLVPTHCVARNCLFVGLAKKPFVVLEEVDADENSLRQLLDWRGEKNAYVNLERLLEVQNFPGLGLDADAWRRNETSDSRFLSAIFDIRPDMRPLSQMSLNQLKPRMESRDELAPYGATLDAAKLPQFPRDLDSSPAP